MFHLTKNFNEKYLIEINACTSLGPRCRFWILSSFCCVAWNLRSVYFPLQWNSNFQYCIRVHVQISVLNSCIISIHHLMAIWFSLIIYLQLKFYSMWWVVRKPHFRVTMRQQVSFSEAISIGKRTCCQSTSGFSSDVHGYLHENQKQFMSTLGSTYFLGPVSPRNGWTTWGSMKSKTFNQENALFSNEKQGREIINHV